MKTVVSVDEAEMTTALIVFFVIWKTPVDGVYVIPVTTVISSVPSDSSDSSPDSSSRCPTAL